MDLWMHRYITIGAHKCLIIVHCRDRKSGFSGHFLKSGFIIHQEVSNEQGKRGIVGIGRLIMDPDFRDGEFAVVVHDDYQGKGLGYKLIDMLIGIAQERGLSMIHGDVLSENRKMLPVASELGFAVKPLAGGISRVELQLR